jgi:NitT/TauT family transport system permease protein
VTNVGTGPARRLLALAGPVALVALWAALTGPDGTRLHPGPRAVAGAVWELFERGLLARHVAASLFRVTWGFLLGAAVGIPVGLALGWSRRAGWALGPFLQVLRPISPLAWIPIAILWFGVGDLPSVFIIFLAVALPLAAAAMNAVRAVPEVHLLAGRNFGLSGGALLARVVVPATLPQLMVALRLALGIAWLVVVAAEMIAVNSGLGFLIIDSRNAGDRYDMVVAGMALIGIIGVLLDAAMRRAEASFREPLGAGSAP